MKETSESIGGHHKQNQDRLDKRAEALRDNLKRRKTRSKEIKKTTNLNKDLNLNKEEE